MSHVIRTRDVIGEAPSFRDLLLPSPLVKHLANVGYIRPSPVQQATIPLARLGLDIIIQAKAGTGKTLVFAVAMAEVIDRSATLPQALVLAPTREVALQAADVISEASSGHVPLAVATVIGGLPTAEDERILRRKCHVVVGTPGRVLSLIQRGSLVTQGISMLVLDEADKLLGSDFYKDVSQVINSVPTTRQVLALSATYTSSASEKLRSFMKQPHEVRLCVENMSLLGIGHYYKQLDKSGSQNAVEAYNSKREALLELLSCISFHQAVIFCNSKVLSETLAQDLIAAGHAAACLSSDKDQLQRIEVLNSLRSFSLRAVVATDVAARGVDLDRVNLVINFDLPTVPATLMHRIGRSGRFGTRGTAISLVYGASERADLLQMVKEAAGGDVKCLPDKVPIGWNAAKPLLIEENVLSAAGNGDFNAPKVIVSGGAAPSIALSSGGASNVQGKALVEKDDASAAVSEILTASLWPEELNIPLITPKEWPLQLADMSPAMQDHSMQSTAEPLAAAQSAPQVPQTPSQNHYETIVKSLQSDLERTEESSTEALELLHSAFCPEKEEEQEQEVSIIVGKVETSEMDASEPRRTRRPLGSAQVTAYTRQVAFEDHQRTLAEEAALLEAMAEGEYDIEEMEDQYADQKYSTEDAWRQYWYSHYEQYGYWPGGSPADNTNDTTADISITTPASDPRTPNTAHMTPYNNRAGAVRARANAGLSSSSSPAVGGWSPESGQAPDVGAVIHACADSGGYVRVPAQILQRYLYLEWQDWQRKFYGNIQSSK